MKLRSVFDRLQSDAWYLHVSRDGKLFFKNVENLLDGELLTSWYQSDDKKLPIDLVIDLGSEQNLIGFKYQPDQRRWNPGIISTFQFYVSIDNKKWKMVSEGEFSNIKNNPLLQIKKFAPAKSRYIKFRALKNTEGNNNTGYANIDIITAD